MASGGDPDPFALELQLNVSIAGAMDGGVLPPERLPTLRLSLERSLDDLQYLLEVKNKLKCVHLRKVNLKKDKCVLLLHFQNLKAVKEFTKFLNKKAGKRGKMKMMSKVLTEFLDKRGVHHSICPLRDQRLSVRAEITEKQSAQAVIHFAKDSDDDQTGSDESENESSHTEEIANDDGTTDKDEETNETKPSGSSTGHASSGGNSNTASPTVTETDARRQVSRPDGYETNRPSSTKDTENPDVVRKNVLLFIPDSYGEVKDVQIRCNSLDNIDKMPMELKNNMWQASFWISASKIHEKDSISFAVRLPRFLKFGGYWDTQTSPMVVLENPSQTIREAYCGWSVEAILAHLTHIFDQASFMDFKECALQLDSFLCSLSQYAIAWDKLVAGVCKFQANGHSKVHMLQAICVGAIYSKIGFPIKIPVEGDIIQEWIHTLSKWRLSDLPTSCSKYIPRVCENLMSCEPRAEMCLMSCIWHFKGFLGEQYFIDKLKGTYARVPCTKAILCDSYVCKNNCLSVCNSLLSKGMEANNPPYDTSHMILKMLLYHLPFEMISKAIESFEEVIHGQTDKYNWILTLALDSASSKLRHCAGEAAKTLKSFIDFLQSIQDYQNLYKESCILVDKLIVCLKHVKYEEYEINRVADMCKTHWFCTEMKNRKRILTAFASSQSKSMHSGFIALAKDQGFIREPDVLNDGCLLLLNNIINLNGRSVLTLPMLYIELCQIWSLPCIRQADETEQKLDKTVVKFLQGLELRDVLGQAERVETHAGNITLAASLFSKHIGTLIIEMFGSNPEGTLSLLSVYPRGRLMNSRYF